jgi:hypothetical protein
MSLPFGAKEPDPFAFPKIKKKAVVAAFGGGQITSDGGVLLLATVERDLGIADTLAGLIADPRKQAYVTHSVSDILRARILAIACGYEDGDDLDMLRTDPGFKLACGKLPQSGEDLCSQPTISRWENAPTLREAMRMGHAMIDLYCRSYPKPPKSVTFDIDDTCDVVHGNQQLSLFNKHYDERCFLPIHVYEHRLDRIDTAAAGSVAIGTRFEVRLEDRLQHQFCGGLHHPVPNRWDAERAFAATGLRDHHPSHRLGPIRFGP